MRILRFLLPIALVCGFGSVAKANDFQMIVIDPTRGVAVRTTTFVFGFVPCQAGDVPGDTTGTYVGCFAGENTTGQIITSLLFEIPPIPGQTAGCAKYGAGLDIFTNVTCTTNTDGYLLDFTGGNIGFGGFFLVAEAGVPPDAFPDVTAIANAPEPGSLWLLSTGILSSGLFFADWRRRRHRVALLIH